MEWILECFISAMPITIGSTLNVAILTNKKVKGVFNVPIDFGKNFIDKKRIFGDNKTWKGLILSTILCALVSIIWGLICRYIPIIGEHNWLYMYNENTILFNVLVGALYGLAYALFELPNSFLKRRLDIKPGHTIKTNGIKKKIFFIIDQIDSGIGTTLVLWCFISMTVIEYFQAIVLFGIVHYLIVRVLYYLKMKESM